MGKKSKIGKARKDKFYQLAKQSGYRSRAAFKLVQINRKFGFLQSAKVLVDLCAAPGSWCQVAAKEMPMSSLIVGVDLVPIASIPGVKTFQADITTDKCRQILKKELLTWKADVILHDGAPNVGTSWSIDEFHQAQLCLQSFALATEFLRAGGSFITKVFRSKDYEPLKWVLDHFFHSVKAMKPEASRLESAEIYLVCQRYKAPDRIDPKFLDIRHVFKDVEAEEVDGSVALMNLHKPMKKKKAEGYSEGDTLFNKLPVSEFIKNPDYLQKLASANVIVFDIPEIEKHKLTTEAIKESCLDIKVQGKPEIKALLKWRKKLIEELVSKEKDKAVVETPVVPEKTEDEEIDEEITRLAVEEMKERKRKLKKVRDNKRKLTQRLQLKMIHPDDQIEQGEDVDIFSLAKVKTAKGLSSGVDLADLDALMPDDHRRPAPRPTQERYERGDDVPNEWNTPADISDDEETDILATGGNADIYLDSDVEEDFPAAAELDEEEDYAEGCNPLLVDLDPTSGRSKEQKRLDAWYQKTAFREVLEEEESESDEEEQRPTKKGASALATSESEDEERDESVEEETDSSSDDELYESMRKAAGRKRKREKRGENDLIEDDGGTEVVQSSTKSAKRHKPLTPEEKALAVKMIRSTKSRRELEEWSYHRYAFDDKDVPSWFAEDERKFMRKQLPVTRSEVVAQKPKEINTRTCKKVLEAKARKKNREMRKLSKVRKNAERIPDEVSEKERWQQIKQIYKKAGVIGQKRRPITYIVNNKSGGRQVGGSKRGAKVKIVDRRLKSDLRGQAKSPRGRGGASKGGKRGGGSSRGGGGSGRSSSGASRGGGRSSSGASRGGGRSSSGASRGGRGGGRGGKR